MAGNAMKEEGDKSKSKSQSKSQSKSMVMSLLIRVSEKKSLPVIAGVGDSETIQAMPGSQLGDH
jgi:hypothetical protein